VSRPSKPVLPFACGHVLTSWPRFSAPQDQLRTNIRQRPCSSSDRAQCTDLVIHRFIIWICRRELAIESLPGSARYMEKRPFQKSTWTNILTLQCYLKRHGPQHFGVVLLTIPGLLHFFRLFLLVFLLFTSPFRQHRPLLGLLHKRETFAKKPVHGSRRYT
jgi:hypothetical protein